MRVEQNTHREPKKMWLHPGKETSIMHMMYAFVHTQKTFTHILFLTFSLCVSHTHTYTHTHTLRRTSNSLQSAAVPCRDERTTPRSENNWNQFKDTYYHCAPCVPPSSSPRLPLPHSLPLSHALLPLSPSPSNSCFLFFIVYHLSSSRLPPQFGSFSSAPFQPPCTDTHIHTHAITHLPLCVLPDTARWERLHYRVELWPCSDCLAREERCVVCMCGVFVFMCVYVCVWEREREGKTEEKEKKRRAPEMRPA